MRLIDLSVELAHHMVRHPAPHLPPVEVVPVANHEVHKRSVQRVTFGTHVSTHIDAPLHAIPDGQTIDQMPLDIMVGEAALLRIPNVSKAKPIDESDLTVHEPMLAKHRRIVLETGWLQSTWGTPGYFVDGPFLTRAAARYLARFDLKLIGMDFPNIDSNEDTRPGFAAPNHNILLGKGILLLENLRNLQEIAGPTFELIALPLRLIGGDGCPARAIARVAS